MDINFKRKRLVLTLDSISLFLTIGSVVLYLLSVFALQDFWSNNASTRRLYSIIFTAVGVGFDLSSVSFDIASYFLGKDIYKSVMNNTADAVEQKLSHHEELSYKFDKFSFIFSTIGLTFGIISLILITVNPSDKLDIWSWAVSIVAAAFDFSSVVLLTMGINQHLKYWHVRNIVKLARESINMSQVRK